jgi:hypothetical protein
MEHTPTDPSAEVRRLRLLRQALGELLGDLRFWTDLLRHKADALRAVAAVPLTPGSLEPEALAEALGKNPPSPWTRGGTQRPRLVSETTEDLLRRARELWETVADPRDLGAARDLADAAGRLADQLEDRWHVTRDQLRSTGDELARALAATRPDQRA